VTKHNSEDKTLYLHVNQPLVIAAVGGWPFIHRSFQSIVYLAVGPLGCSKMKRE
jgi:hypothetical protein